MPFLMGCWISDIDRRKSKKHWDSWTINMDVKVPGDDECVRADNDGFEKVGKLCDESRDRSGMIPRDAQSENSND